MGKIVVHDLSEKILRAVRSEARSHGRSVEAEVEHILAEWTNAAAFRRYVRSAARSPRPPRTMRSSARIVRESRDAT